MHLCWVVTGVSAVSEIQHEKVKVKVVQLCLTLPYPIDYTVHGIPQARILEWVAFPFSRGCSQHFRKILYQQSHKGSPRILEWVFSRGSSQPRSRNRVSCLAGRFFTN